MHNTLLLLLVMVNQVKRNGDMAEACTYVWTCVSVVLHVHILIITQVYAAHSMLAGKSFVWHV